MAITPQESGPPSGSAQNAGPIIRTVAVGGQPHTPPPGTRIVEPPPDTRQAERGSFYAVVELAGNHPQREQMIEHLLSVLQRTYYSAKGKQSSVLIESIRQAMVALNEFNARQPQSPLQAGIVCAGLLRGRLIVTNVGPAFAMTRVRSKLEMFPPRLPNWPVADPTEVSDAHEVFRWDLSDGDGFFLGGASWEHTGALRLLAATVAHVDDESLDDAVSGLRADAVAGSLSGILSVAVDRRPASQPLDSVSLGQRSAVPGLPTSVIVPPANPSSASKSAISPPTVNTPTGSTPAFSSDESAYAASEAATTTATTVPAYGSVDDTTTTVRRTSTFAPTGWTRLRNLLRNVLPDVGQGDRPNPTAQQTAGKQTVGGMAVDSDGTPIASYRPPAPAQGSRARLYVLGSLALAIAIPAIVAAVIWRNGAANRAEAEAMLQRAVGSVASAQTAVDTGNKAAALTALTDARDALKNRAAMFAGPDTQADQLTQQIEQLSQQVLQVQPLYGLVTPLIRFADAAARPTHVIVVDQDIFILDEGRQLIERYRLDESQELVPDPQGVLALQQGQQVDGATVDELIDFTWQPPVPGYEDKSNLLVLDRKGQVFRFNPRLEGPGLIALGGREQLKQIRQLRSYSGRLYLADVGSNQVYRFPPGQYEQAPEAWFNPQTTVDLTGLRRLRIDGNIWMLFDNGQIMRFFNGEQASFSLDKDVGTVREPVDLAVSEQENGLIYIADRAGQRVMVFTKDGSYKSQLIASEGNVLENLNGIYIDDNTDSLYLLTDTALWKQALPK